MNTHSDKAALALPIVTLVATVGWATAARAEALFVDVTAASGMEFVHFNGMSGELYFPEMMGSGVALFDFDGDDDLDVYLVQGQMLGDAGVAAATLPPPAEPPLTDRLFRNDGPDGDGVPRFTDVTGAAGLAATGYGMGVAAGDYDCLLYTSDAADDRRGVLMSGGGGWG